MPQPLTPSPPAAPLPLLLSLLSPERQLVQTFPPAYNEQISPYSEQRHFSRATAAELLQREPQRPLQLRPCKVIFIGDVSVGKTTIVHRFCYDKFQTNYKATIGVDFEIENFSILGQNFCLEIWDTAGQERFKCIAQAYYRNANVVVVVFDMTKLNSLQSATNWLKSALAVNTIPNPLIFLVGTKSDLLSLEDFRRIENLAAETATTMKAEYWSLSARTGYNIVDFFQRMAALAFDAAAKVAISDRRHMAQAVSKQMLKKSQKFDFRNMCNEKKRFCSC